MIFSRRTALKALGIGAVTAALPLSMPNIARGASKVTFTTSWLPEGPNLFAYVARDKGFWKNAGLDVSVARGSGSNAAAQAVSAGTFDFGMAPTPTVIIQAARGLPITCIGQVNYEVLMGIGMLADSPIKEPKDLEGKRLGASVTSGEFPFLPLYAAKAGFDLETVEIVQLDGKVRERSLAEGQVDAVSAFATSTVPSLAPLGTDVRFMLFKNAGIDFYGQALTTQPDRLQNDPELCEALVQGAMEAVKFTQTDFDESIDIFLKANSEVAISGTGEEYARIGLGLVNLTNLVPELIDHGFGYADPAKVEAMADFVMEYGAGEGASRPDLEALITNRFAGKVKFTPEELAAAEARSQEFKKFLL
ncbi:ABC transporter substrate-binding protein [Aureimonas fodinaquatilis]|uniref:ABC transporter substrate-binding protein n=1 Tax=Aureimonas fodinaquatilis TaxID=2565783 RepID=A0A5B0DWQ9_9HYPH|nr:ABC transporter substrate-binding protein [Aureimonas fodinaquatilis]KAA0970903.1 ABC transporter substrate-binding protein [Aureimonas fodinaquatilis]